MLNRARSLRQVFGVPGPVLSRARTSGPVLNRARSLQQVFETLGPVLSRARTPGPVLNRARSLQQVSETLGPVLSRARTPGPVLNRARSLRPVLDWSRNHRQVFGTLGPVLNRARKARPVLCWFRDLSPVLKRSRPVLSLSRTLGPVLGRSRTLRPVLKRSRPVLNWSITPRPVLSWSRTLGPVLSRSRTLGPVLSRSKPLHLHSLASNSGWKSLLDRLVLEPSVSGHGPCRDVQPGSHSPNLVLWLMGYCPQGYIKGQLLTSNDWLHNYINTNIVNINVLCTGSPTITATRSMVVPVQWQFHVNHIFLFQHGLPLALVFGLNTLHWCRDQDTELKVRLGDHLITSGPFLIYLPSSVLLKPF